MGHHQRDHHNKINLKGVWRPHWGRDSPPRDPQDVLRGPEGHGEVGGRTPERGAEARGQNRHLGAKQLRVVPHVARCLEGGTHSGKKCLITLLLHIELKTKSITKGFVNF